MCRVASHIMATFSTLPVTRAEPSGDQARSWTSSVWPRRVPTAFHAESWAHGSAAWSGPPLDGVAAFVPSLPRDPPAPGLFLHTTTSPESPADTMVLPSGENRTTFTPLLCAERLQRYSTPTSGSAPPGAVVVPFSLPWLPCVPLAFSVILHSRTSLSAPHVTSSPSLLKSTEKTGFLSCHSTWRVLTLIFSRGRRALTVGGVLYEVRRCLSVLCPVGVGVGGWVPQSCPPLFCFGGLAPK